MQTTYSNTVENGYEGQIATAVASTVITGLPAAAVQAGHAVVIEVTGTVDEAVRSPVLTGEVTGPVMAGLVVRESVREDVDFPANKPIGVMRKGEMFVRVEDAVTRGAFAFVRFTAGGAEVLGALRSDADTADAVACPGIKFLQTVGAGEICRVSVDL